MTCLPGIVRLPTKDRRRRARPTGEAKAIGGPLPLGLRPPGSGPPIAHPNRRSCAHRSCRAADIAEVQTAEGKLYLFVGIDRTSKFAVTQLVDKADRRTAWEFLEHLLKAVPYRIHTILTDNGIQFAEQPRNRNTAWSRQMRFDMICEANNVEHRLTKPNHPWTNGQVERMNRTIKEATVKRFHYESHEQLRVHLADFMAAYNFARRLKTLSGLTPYEFIAKIWKSEPDRFIVNPIHQMPGLNT
ncbi:transposase InsO family protein [Sphingomonas sp. UYEF23]